MVKEIYKKKAESEIETKSDQDKEAVEEVNNQTEVSESTFLSENQASPMSKTAKKGTYNPMYQCPPPQNNCYQPGYYAPPGGHCHPGYPGGGGQPGYYPNNPNDNRDRGGCGSFLQGILACTLCLACFKCCCCCCDECCDAAC